MISDFFAKTRNTDAVQNNILGRHGMTIWKFFLYKGVGTMKDECKQYKQYKQNTINDSVGVGRYTDDLGVLDSYMKNILCELKDVDITDGIDDSSYDDLSNTKNKMQQAKLLKSAKLLELVKLFNGNDIESAVNAANALKKEL